MNPNLKRILVFVLQFVPLFLLFFAVYLVVLPRYDPLVRGTANAITMRMDPATQIESSPHGGWTAFVFTPEKGRRQLRNLSISSAHLVYISLVMLPALLLATPAPFLARLKLLGIGVTLVFAGHVVSLVVITRGLQCLREAPGTFYCLWGLRLAYTSGQLLAAAFWVLLTWRYWFQPAATGPAGPGVDPSGDV